MITVAICDDDIDFSLYLQNYLESQFQVDLEIKIYSNPISLIEEINNIDILFLDYDMPFLNGMKVLEKIKKTPIIKIMVSNYSHIIFDTYQYRLFWFVRKKHLKYDIGRLLPFLEREVINNKVGNFEIYTNNKYLNVEFKYINYIEKSGNYLLIYTDFKKYKIRASFSSIVSQFDNLRFIIPLHGVIININYILYLDLKNNTVHLKNNVQFPISRNKKKGVVKMYAMYNHKF